MPFEGRLWDVTWQFIWYMNPPDDFTYANGGQNKNFDIDKSPSFKL